MRTLFVTSVQVPALVDQLGNHEAAFRAFERFTSGEHSGCCSTHAVAECYATLTALPVATRISPDEARILIEKTVLALLTALAMAPDDYRDVLREVAGAGLRSGAIYDALHARCARKDGVDQILTYNLSDFACFDLGETAVAAP